MGKKREGKNLESVSRTPISLREEATGKIQSKAAINNKSNLRFHHLKNLTLWASTTHSPIPSLAAFYAHQFAAFGEATGVPPDPSFITCQRCETVLQPGFNSTVRIEKNKSKARHKRKKFGTINQNYVVYKCLFCFHQNLRRGTPKGYLKEISPSKDRKSLLESTSPSKLEKGIVNKDEGKEIGVFASQVVAKDVALVDGLATPLSTNTPTLLEGKKRIRNSSSSKKDIQTTNMAASTASKRRRKSWTSLKEIAKSNQHENTQIANLRVPFFL
ncbi:uncharacterized protein LOC113848094 [Abrus precatorius]|uniref:Uncharacterized protein LOC113848094 n=1 Tax=Abrus precatorius TaxID=3816 RepID=A0A8B8JRW5_ABRPR|nr:uncharacterized protein LOC113848094 [Abrus precatorius]